MFTAGRFPVYTEQTTEQAAESLTTVLAQLKLRELRGLQSYPLKKLELNVAPDEELRDALIAVHGVGMISINKILCERAIGGDFHGSEDFDRRIKGLRYERLEHMCQRSAISLSFMKTRPFELSATKISPVPRVLTKRERSIREFGGDRWAGESDDNSVLLASWNTGRMSRNGVMYEQKIRHLLRFVRESDVHVLCLQEVCRGVPEHLLERFEEEFQANWKLFADFSKKSTSDSSLTILFRCDSIRARSSVGKCPPPLSLVRTFQRVPQVAFLSSAGHGDDITVLVHVHLLQADPRSEVSVLPFFLAKLRRYMDNRDNKGATFLLVGDFNLNSDSIAFDRLRELGMVEIVRPMNGNALHPHPFKMIHGATTVGGQWFDNVWICEKSRGKIRDAWCFDFGGRCRGLDQSGYDFAAERRSCSSDHLPLVVRIQLSRGDKQMPGS